MSLHVEFQKVGETLSRGRKLASNNARGQSALWMGSCRCDLIVQVKSFHWEKVLGGLDHFCVLWMGQQDRGTTAAECSTER